MFKDFIKGVIKTPIWGIYESEKAMLSEYKDICLLCGKPKQETHHLVFGRGLRELADKDHLTASLCSECHKAIHYNGVASAESKIIGQLIYEIDKIEQGMTQAEAREEFRKRYGRSYL